jgi:hypothetical protein
MQKRALRRRYFPQTGSAKDLIEFKIAVAYDEVRRHLRLTRVFPTQRETLIKQAREWRAHARTLRRLLESGAYQ